MRKYALYATAAAVALAFALPVFSQQPKTEQSKTKKHEYTGVIQTMDVAKGTFVVKKKDETKTFSCAADCKIGDKKDAKLADLKVGDKVNVGYTEEAGKLICHKVQLTPPPAAKAEEKKAPAAK